MFVDFKEVAGGGDDWESFSRDLLVMLGFAVEAPPNRGADGGKDLIVVEHLTGKLGRYPFRWLVSCKHNAHSGKSVSESDEPNLVERVVSHRCDGFMGLYSTVPSSGLAQRLHSLKSAGNLKDYRVLDSRIIENHLVTRGFAPLLLRYLPQAYARLKPIHPIAGKYVPLTCARCSRDLFEPKGLEDYAALVSIVSQRPQGEADYRRVVDIYWACKNPCNLSIEKKYTLQGLSVGWEDVSDLVIPTWYIRWTLTLMNRLRDGDDIYEDTAYEKMKELLIALGQKVLREVTETEKERVRALFEIQPL